jgi:hypothetical protein
MFCPACATQNIDPAKFCRACGTNLEVISLALAAEANPAAQKTDQPSSGYEIYFERKQAAKRQMVQGGILLGVSALLAVMGLLAAKEPFLGFMLWSVFFGWMACWGTVTLAIGSSKLIGAKAKMPHNKATGQIKSISPPAPAFSSSPFSITERTTRHLEERSQPAVDSPPKTI